MAKRRLAGAFAGLGQGLTNASDILLRTMMQDRLQERYDRRAAENAKAIAAREETAANRRAALALMEKTATGDADPEGASEMLSLLLGKPIDAAQVPQQSPRRRLENTIGKSITDAKTPEDVPTDLDIIGVAKSRGVNDMLSPEMLVADATTDHPFAVSPPEVRELGARAGVRRRSLDVPEIVDYEDPITGAKGKRTVSRRDPAMATGVTLGPTSEQAGALAGQRKSVELETSGDAIAAQVGREAQARQNVELSPEAQQARTAEAVNREVATLKATFPIQLKLATEKAALEVQQSVNKENAANVAAGARAAQQLAPFFDRVSELTKALNTEESGLLARAKGAVLTAKSYAGSAPKVQELEQLISQNARQLAVAMGVREANVSERETQQALKGIGLSQWSTATERRNALRNLQDLITLGPAVAARVPSNAGIGERMAVAQELTKYRRTAEQEAIAAGAETYLDPVTGGLTKVIK